MTKAYPSTEFLVPANSNPGSKERLRAARHSLNGEYFRDPDGEAIEFLHGSENMVSNPWNIITDGINVDEVIEQMIAKEEARELRWAKEIRDAASDDAYYQQLGAAADARIARRTAHEPKYYTGAENDIDRKWRKPDSAGIHGRRQAGDRDRSYDPNLKQDVDGMRRSARSPYFLHYSPCAETAVAAPPMQPPALRRSMFALAAAAVAGTPPVMPQPNSVRGLALNC